MIDRKSVLAQELLNSVYLTLDQKEKILLIYNEIKECYPLIVENNSEAFDDYQEFTQFQEEGRLIEAFYWEVCNSEKLNFGMLYAVLRGERNPNDLNI